MRHRSCDDSCLLMGGADREAVYDGRSRPVPDGPADRPRRSMRPQHPAPIELEAGPSGDAVGRQEAGGMLSAYVLIETEVGKVAHVAQALTKLDGVQLAEDLAGPYDIIARLQAPSLDELGQVVVAHIQLL